MKNKSFILCIAGIGILVVMGCYVFWRDGGMQPEMDTTDKHTEQEENSVDNVDNNENEVDFLAFNDDVSESYQIENNGIILSIPQVEFEQLEEGTLEEKINMTLRKASTNWITEDMINRYTCGEPWVYLNTKNLLSICQPFGTKSGFSHSIYNYITIDMNSGEQIYLDDILDIEKFCDFLLKGEKYRAPDHQFTLDQEDADNAVREHVTNLAKEGLMDVLQCCCREQKDFVDGYSRKFSAGLVEKPDFYLENTQLVIELEGEWHTRVIIEYKDLKDILNENFKQELLSYKKNMPENYKINNYKFVLSVPQVDFGQLEDSTLEEDTLEKLEELEEKINVTLGKESVNWIADIIVTGYNSYLESITYLNDNNLLSMGMTYHAENEFSDQEFYKHNFITMDMDSGEQIYLDDILDIEKFCDFLLKGEKSSVSSFPLWDKKMDAEEIILEHLKKMEKKELLDILRYCKFYLQNSKLVIELDDEWHAFITITYKDLENVLNQDFKQRLVQCSVSEQKEEKKNSDISKINNYSNPIDEYFEPKIDGTESMAEATRRDYERLYKYVWKTEYENIMKWMKKKCKYSEDKENIEKMEESVDNYIESALSVMETEMIDGYDLDPSKNRVEGNGVYSGLDRICGTMYRNISMKLINLSEGNGKPYNFMERDYSEIMIP